jgi:hypothetical protein
LGSLCNTLLFNLHNGSPGQWVQSVAKKCEAIKTLNDRKSVLDEAGRGFSYQAGR